MSPPRARARPVNQDQPDTDRNLPEEAQNLAGRHARSVARERGSLQDKSKPRGQESDEGKHRCLPGQGTPCSTSRPAEVDSDQDQAGYLLQHSEIQKKFREDRRELPGISARITSRGMAAGTDSHHAP